MTTGKLDYYERLRSSIPPGHLEMLKIPNLGPRKIRALYQTLGITTLKELEAACRENRLVNLPGFGAKTQSNILKGIERLKHYQNRRLYLDALAIATPLLAAIKDSDITHWSLAGSLRRGAETVKDIDILTATTQPHRVADLFIHVAPIETILAHGETKVSVLLTAGISCDLRIVSPENFPYALHHLREVASTIPP